MTLFFNAFKKNDLIDPERSFISDQFLKKANICGPEDFVEKIERIVKKASLLDSGAKILKKTAMFIGKVKIIPSEEGKNRFEHVKKQVQLNLLVGANYYLSLGENNEKFLIKQPKCAIFLHELIHVYNFYKNRKAYKNRLKEFLSDEMHNSEERLGIEGKLFHGNRLKIQKLCENNVLEELGLPKRVDHLGVQVGENSSPTIFDMFQVRALGDIRKKLTNNIQLIDQLDVPEKIQAKCAETLGGFEFPLEKLIDLAILTGYFSAIKSFVEMGWQPTSEHLTKAFLALDIYRKLRQDKNLPLAMREIRTTLSSKAIIKYLASLEAIVDLFEHQLSRKLKRLSPISFQTPSRNP